MLLLDFFQLKDRPLALPLLGKMLSNKPANGTRGENKRNLVGTAHGISARCHERSKEDMAKSNFKIRSMFQTNIRMSISNDRDKSRELSTNIVFGKKMHQSFNFT